MRKIASSLLLLTSIALPISSNAADYTIQVGAFKTTPNETIQQAQKFGEVFQKKGSDELTRITVGRFSNRVDADKMRDKLQNSGFGDAYVTTILDTTNYSEIQQESFTKAINLETNSLKQTTYTQVQNTSVYDIDDLNADELSKASYLDGQLRILSNGHFYTVEQYRNQN